MIAARHMLTIRPQVSSADPVNWLDQSACAEIGPGLWDDQSVEGPRQKERREALAKSICADCPVIAACRAFAITTDQNSGIWGGLTEKERDGLGIKLKIPGFACSNKRGTGAGASRHRRAEERVCTDCTIGESREHSARNERRRSDRIAARDYMARSAVAS